MGVKCPKCNTNNPSDSKYCKECATPLPSLEEISRTKTLEAPTDELTIDISGIHPFNQNYRVDVTKVDSTWHSNFHLYVRRTSDGSGHNKSTISAGITYQEVTDIDQTFFSGMGGKDAITIQLNLTGVSIQVLPDSYITTIYYTALEI